MTSWLRGTSRDGDPQDHIHNQIARITRTTADGKWRAHDTASLRAVLRALQGIAATVAECELTREFGVAWVPRADGRGNEIAGNTQAQMDAFSTRTVQVHAKERELAQAWQRRHGRAPNARELAHLAQKATLQSPHWQGHWRDQLGCAGPPVGCHPRRRAGRHRPHSLERARPAPAICADAWCYGPGQLFCWPSAMTTSGPEPMPSMSGVRAARRSRSS